MTDIYFAVANYYGINNATFGRWDWKAHPLNILCAFPFLDHWWKRDFETPGIRTMLDSGAYSAWGAGEVIDFDALCKEAAKPEWDEVVALDVIGDAEASLRNALAMKKRGLNVIPVLHFGEPWTILSEYVSESERIGLASGHGAKFAERMRWTEQCFTRAYGTKFHSFGWVDERPLMAFPFWTADTASWHSSTRWGRLASTPNIRVPKTSELGRPVNDLRSEIAFYVELEARVKDRWSSELAKLETSTVDRRYSIMSQNENEVFGDETLIINDPVSDDNLAEASPRELTVEPVEGSESTGEASASASTPAVKPKTKKQLAKEASAAKKAAKDKAAAEKAKADEAEKSAAPVNETGVDNGGVKTPNRPGAGTATGKVWETFDELVANNTAPSRKAVIEASVAKGVNKATAGVQYKRALDAFIAGGGVKPLGVIESGAPGTGGGEQGNEGGGNAPAAEPTVQ